MGDAAQTFEAIWRRTGLADVGELDHGATIRVPLGTASGSSHMPHLSIGQDDPDGEPVEAQLLVERLLGEGGMGMVHLARQPLLDRHVAIKRVREDAPRGAAASLFREARTMGSLEHPNIPPVHALGADGAGQPILVMKQIVGIEWAELIASDPDHGAWAWFHGMSTDRIARHVEVLIQLCRAVHFAHERGVLHLDLKPENAMLAEDGAIYVLDWGIARRMDEAGKRRVAGTPAYMAPELVDLSMELSRATDVYLLGGCLHEVLTGRPPHTGDSVKLVMARAHLSAPPEFDEGLPAELCAICARCLAADPTERFETVDALREALVFWLRTRGSNELAASAREALAKMERRMAADPPDAVAIGRAFAEAHFGFDRALEQWPENPTALEGKDRALRQMIAFEIDRENLDHARALVADLGAQAEFEDRLAASEARIVKRKELEREGDLEVGRPQRAGFILVLGLVGLAITVAILVGSDPRDLVPRDGVFIALGFNAVVFGLALVGRRWLFQNAINASITLGVLVIGASVLLSRINAWWRGAESMGEVLTADLQMMACGLGVAWAFLRHRGLAVAAVILAAGSVLGTVFPSLAVNSFGIVTALGLLTGGVYWYWLSDPS